MQVAILALTEKLKKNSNLFGALVACGIGLAYVMVGAENTYLGKGLTNPDLKVTASTIGQVAINEGINLMKEEKNDINTLKDEIINAFAIAVVTSLNIEGLLPKDTESDQYKKFLMHLDAFDFEGDNSLILTNITSQSYKEELERIITYLLQYKTTEPDFSIEKITDGVYQTFKDNLGKKLNNKKFRQELDTYLLFMLSDKVEVVINKLNELKPTYYRPDLFLPDVVSEFTDNIQILDYQSEFIEFKGREVEISKIKDLLNNEKSFAWMMLEGNGGSGKSRIGLESCRIAQKMGYDAGFLVGDSILTTDQLWKMQSLSPSYIVLDYAMSNKEKTNKILDRLNKLCHNSNPKYKQKIRLLLIDRTFDQNWLNEMKRGTFMQTCTSKSNGEISPLKLQDSIEDFRIELIIAALEGFRDKVVINNDEDSKECRYLLEPAKCEQLIQYFNSHQSEILNKLSEIDPQQLPLFTIAATRALLADTNLQEVDWTKEALMNNIYDREVNYWSKFTGFNDNENTLHVLFSITTLCRGLLEDEIFTIRNNDEFWSGLFIDKPIKEVTDILKHIYGQEIKTEDKRNDFIVSGIQPDLFGEYVVLKTFEKLSTAKKQKHFIDFVWTVKPEQVAWSMNLMFRDYFSRESNVYNEYIETIFKNQNMEAYIKFLFFTSHYESRNQKFIVSKWEETGLSIINSKENYAGYLFNIYIKNNAGFARLKQLYQDYPENQRIALNLALSYRYITTKPDATVNQCIEAAKEIGAIWELKQFKDDAEIAIELAMCLNNISCIPNASIDQCRAAAEDIRIIRTLKQLKNNPIIAQELTKCIYNISVKIETNINQIRKAAKKIRKIRKHEPLNKIPEIALMLTYCLINISNHPRATFHQCRKAANEIRELHKLVHLKNNESIVLSLSKCLFNNFARVIQNFNTKKAIIAEIESLYLSFPSVDLRHELMRIYGALIFDLFYFQECLPYLERVNQLTQENPTENFLFEEASIIELAYSKPGAPPQPQKTRLPTGSTQYK